MSTWLEILLETGQWRHSGASPTERDDSENVNNVIEVGDIANVRPSIQQQKKDANVVKVIERPLTENERSILAKAARCVAFSVCPIRLSPKKLETKQDIFEEVLHGDLDFSSEPEPSISYSAKDLVKQTLVRDPKKRLTAHEVLCNNPSLIWKSLVWGRGLIPLSNSGVGDKLAWHYTKSGEFSVSSAYRVQRDNKNLNTGSSCLSSSNGIWKNLWNHRISKKLCFFLWRACKDRLPTALNLAKKRIISSPLCWRCPDDCETLLHAVWGCKKVKKTWYHCPFLEKIQIYDGNNNFMDFYQAILLCLTGEEQGLFISLCWHLWHARNAAVYGKNLQDISLLWDSSQAWICNFWTANEGALKTTVVSIIPRWFPPPQCVAKGNTDTSWKGENAAAVGLLIRDVNGSLFGAVAKPLPHSFSPLEDEIQGIIEGFKFAHQKNLLLLLRVIARKLSYG